MFVLHLSIKSYTSVLLEWCAAFCPVGQIGGAWSIHGLDPASPPEPAPWWAQQGPSGHVDAGEGWGRDRLAAMQS